MAKDERSMKLFKCLADTIHSSIKVEVDYCSNHGDRKLPILDLKVWVERKALTDGKGVGVILHEFYSKGVASRYVVHSRSAFPWSVKRTILTQEVLRVLLNCSPLLPWDCTIRHIENMVLRIQYSGYSERFRHDVVQSALAAYKKIVELDKSGVRPLYRTKDWKRSERKKEKENKKRQWFRKGGYSSNIVVPATPGSELRRRLENDVRGSGVKIRIVERAEVNVKRVLQRSDPLRRGEDCGKNDCLVCTTGGKGSCKSSGITYELKCTSCGDVYIGETARSAYVRGREHLQALRSEYDSSVMLRHCREKHDGSEKNFVMNVTGVFEGDAMLRQLSESTKILKQDPSRLINNKTEWNYFSIPRARVE